MHTFILDRFSMLSGWGDPYQLAYSSCKLIKATPVGYWVTNWRL